VTSVPSPERTLRVAVLGCGNVGSALVGILQSRADALAVQAGARLVIAGIAVRDLAAPRPDHVPRELLTTDAAALVADERVDIVVELIGGLEPAGALVSRGDGQQGLVGLT
jgi:homoserine dehydrogenase